MLYLEGKDGRRGRPRNGGHGGGAGADTNVGDGLQEKENKPFGPSPALSTVKGNSHSVRTTVAEEWERWGPDWAVGEDEEEPLVALHGVEAVQTVGGGHGGAVGGAHRGEGVSQGAAPAEPALKKHAKSITHTVLNDLIFIHVRASFDIGVDAFRLMICWAAPQESWHGQEWTTLQLKKSKELKDYPSFLCPFPTTLTRQS